MAIFSRITAGLVIGCIATTSLIATPVEALDSSNGHVVARSLRHPQARAHRPFHGSVSRRAADKKKVCSAKKAKAAEVKVDPKVEEKKEDDKKDEPKEEPKPKPKNNDKGNDDGGNGGGNGSGGQPAPGGGKAGLCWNDGKTVSMKPWTATGKVTWTYSWSPWDNCDGNDCPEFVPMLWSGKQLEPWKNMVEGKTWGHVLGFNEPDIAGQSSMGVDEAVRLWRDHVQPVKARHISPAVTTSPKGRQWMKEFLNKCTNCDIDALAYHYYGLDPDDFIKTIKEIHDDHPEYRIWITEWAAHNYGSNQHIQADLGDIRAFMSKTQAFLDNTSWIERYAWFAPITQMPGNFNPLNRIMTPGGQINDLGRQYIAW